MLNENAKKWVKALRSGDYQQTYFYLKRGQRYCVLGVAMKVAEKNGIELEESDWQNEALPKNVRDWLGLDDAEGGFKHAIGDVEDLMSLNDKAHWAFEDLADLIEKEPKGLFQEKAKKKIAKKITKKAPEKPITWCKDWSGVSDSKTKGKKFASLV